MASSRATQAAVVAASHDSRGAQFLDSFAAFQQFVEDLLSLGNGWLLLISTGVALASLMLDLRHPAGILLLAWALSQIFGVDLQFFVAMVRARTAYAQQRWGAMWAWIALAAILAVAIWQSLYAFGVENATGMSEAQVFAQWGMSILVFLGERAFLVVLLMTVAAITRHSRTVTDAQLVSGHAAPRRPTPPDDDGGLPSPAQSERLTVPAAAAKEFAPAKLERSRRRPAAVASDPRTGRSSRISAELRAQREAFAQDFFNANPKAGPTDLAQALGIKPGGTVDSLWKLYGHQAA